MAIDGLSFFAVAMAFTGGLVSFVSPCVLPLVPVYLGHLSGVSAEKGGVAGGRVVFLHALVFVAGFSAVFIALGATIGILGGFAGGHLQAVSRAAGIVLIVLGAYTAGAFRLPGIRRVTAGITKYVDGVYYRERRYHSAFGTGPAYWRSLGVGGAFAVGWVPCITPVLGAILTLAYSGAIAGQNTGAAGAQAAILLTFYAAGLGLPFLAAGLLMGKITPLFKRLQRLMPAVTVASGLLIVFVGVMVFENWVTRLDQYFGFLPYVKF